MTERELTEKELESVEGGSGSKLHKVEKKLNADTLVPRKKKEQAEESKSI